ncbi:MAG: hypothetical protein NVS4B11_23970 [Ktedonobacteraceae bacterium]
MGVVIVMQPENVYPRQSNNGDDMSSLVGRSLGQFRVVERIGAGGMATVFKAYQPTLDRYVAIKVLPPYHARDQVFVKRFVQEARSVAKLTHPNIVQIHDFSSEEEGNITYIVMEYVDGGTLKDRLKRALPVPEAAGYIIQAAEGLDCAHRHGIIHRDVKPANMLLRKDGHLLLSDFGIAKILEGTTNLTRVGTGIGTPQYMSPEQGTGQGVDRRSDIYSLGIVFFHCLTGRVPFTADSPLSITIKHLHDPIPAERMIAEGVPNPIVQVVLQMTAKDAHERYQSADAVIDALTQALEASNLAMPRMRFGFAPSGPFAEPKSIPLGQVPNANGRSSNPSNPVPSNAKVQLVCFRCGALSDSSQVYCTACGYELSDKQAGADRFRGPNGRPILARLSIQNGPMGGRTYRFHQVVTSIGRTNGNDLIISGRTVSRTHAQLWFDAGRWFLKDLQSANGTLINGIRIVQTMPLNDGDVINFGDEVVVFNVAYGS